jgi:hypothetical protein
MASRRRSAQGLTLVLGGDEPLQGERHWLCTSCGAKFPLHHESIWERHVINCYRDNAHNVEEHIAAKESNVYQSPADKELYDWVRKGGN